MAKFYAGNQQQVSARETRNMEKVRRIAADGMVLLENSGVLPLQNDGRRLAVKINDYVRKLYADTHDFFLG